MSIHPTAIVDPGAEIGSDVEVGPYAVIGSDVVVGDRCRILEHASLRGPLVLGEDCVVEHAAALGFAPQVVGNDGPFGAVRIGRGNVFREFVQVQRSMHPDGETVIGDRNYFMNTAHVAHDCVIGDEAILCNSVLLAGHVHVGDRAFFGGNAGMHQFCRVGELAMVGGGSGVAQDVPPYCLVADTRPARLEGLNTVGLRRAGVRTEVRRALKEAYRVLFRTDDPLPERLAAVDRSVPEVARMVAFVEESERGVIGFGGAAGK